MGWPQFTASSRNILEFDESRSVVLEDDSSDQETCAFWNRLVPALEQVHTLECEKKTRTRLVEESMFKPIKLNRDKKHQPTLGTRRPTTTTTKTARRSSLTTKRSTTATTTPSTTTTTRQQPSWTSKTGSEYRQKPLFVALQTERRPFFATPSTTTLKPAIPKSSFDSSSVRLGEDDSPGVTASSADIFKRLSTSNLFSSYSTPQQLAEEEVPAINSLRRHSLLAADHPVFKLVDSSQVVTAAPYKRFSEAPKTGSPSSSMPENKKLSYSLSVVDRNAQAFRTPNIWTLYKPEEPGNSPIYVASTAIQEENSQSDEDHESGGGGSPYPVRGDSVSARPRRPEVHRDRYNNNSSNSNRKPVTTYDPFNVASYTRSYATRRRDDGGSTGDILPAVPQTTERNPFYFPTNLRN